MLNAHNTGCCCSSHHQRQGGGEIQEGPAAAETRLAQAFSHLGTVVAITSAATWDMHSAWALVTFSQADEMKHTLATESTTCAPFDAHEGLGSHGTFGDVARAHVTKIRGSIAAACVPPLVEILKMDVSVVDAEELQRATLCLAELFSIDPLAVGGALMSGNRAIAHYWQAPNNAYAAVWAKKQPLTAQDAMTIGCCNASVSAIFARGWQACTDVATNADTGQFLEAFLSSSGFFNATEEIIIRLSLLTLEILRDTTGLSVRCQAGLWITLPWAMSGRASVAMALIDAGLFDVASTAIQRSGSPVDWVSWKTQTGPLVGQICAIGSLNVGAAQRKY